MSYASDVDDTRKTLLYDPQTAGGLLISVAQKDAQALLSALHENGVDSAVIIGRAIARSSKDTPLIRIV